MTFDHKEVHRLASESSVQLACAQGHQWSKKITHAAYGPCPHIKEEQVDFICPNCGAGQSIIGGDGIVHCPRCRETSMTKATQDAPSVATVAVQMICPKCAAARTEDKPDDVRCPVCGGRPTNVINAPAVRFSGDVVKIIGGL